MGLRVVAALLVATCRRSRRRRQWVSDVFERIFFTGCPA
jgi:hypothetical protein